MWCLEIIFFCIMKRIIFRNLFQRIIRRLKMPLGMGRGESFIRMVEDVSAGKLVPQVPLGAHLLPL